ncbi:MAG: Tyrosine recombinase XerC [Candidatus Lokiarchaeum sp. GC14_75]|nr:MAG: Tyrosine recombinase XerC [Candidatus Lokiarchaeum sp. GC14_75]
MDESKYKNYEDHFKGEKALILTNKTNQFYVNSYLVEVKKRSDGAYRNQKSALKSFFDYLDKPVDKIYMWDVINYFNDVLEGKSILKDSKETRRSYLKSFFSYVQGTLASKQTIYQNPVPNYQIYKFKSRDTDIKKQSEKNEKILTKTQLLEILNYIKKNYTKNKRTFIFFCLCECTGARYSEIRTIKIENINLEERYFETGFEKNAMKSTRTTGESLLFFFPDTFKTYLKNYIILCEKKGEKWLFPSPHNNQKHIGINGVDYYYQQVRKALGFHFSMHYFRHSLINHLKRNGCSRDDREMLLNHVPSSTEGRHYEHDEIEQMREIYDKYFPYYSFPYFKKF